MFVTNGRTNYDNVFDDLLAQFLEQDRVKIVDVTFFDEPHRVRQDGIYAGSRKIGAIGGILVLRYLLRESDDKIRNEWVPYREFRDGSNFASYIKTNIEDIIAREFAGHKELLIEKLESLGSKPHALESRPDVSMITYAFPSIPILSVFWDQDEEFPPSFQFLFDRSAPSFLDMESLAVLLHYTHLKITGA